MNAILSISGKYLSEIQVAIPEFEKRGLHLSEYQVSLLKHDDNFVVVFSKGERSPGLRGSPPGSPGFEVEVEGIHR